MDHVPVRAPSNTPGEINIVSIKHAVLLVLACLILSACFLKPYKIPIQQGNFLDPAVIAKLKPGMTRSQVKFLLGTPLITDPFHPERWDYVYYVDNEWQKPKDVRRLSLLFEGDKLKQAKTNVPEQDAGGKQGTLSTR
jgi:outer membrane protein assembly factor BamE